MAALYWIINNYYSCNNSPPQKTCDGSTFKIRSYAYLWNSKGPTNDPHTIQPGNQPQTQHRSTRVPQLSPRVPQPGPLQINTCTPYQGQAQKRSRHQGFKLTYPGLKHSTRIFIIKNLTQTRPEKLINTKQPKPPPGSTRAGGQTQNLYFTRIQSTGEAKAKTPPYSLT